jgi:hypothetical protein
MKRRTTSGRHGLAAFVEARYANTGTSMNASLVLWTKRFPRHLVCAPGVAAF